MLHRKLSCHTRKIGRRLASANAVATARELTRKYVSTAASSGWSGVALRLPGEPPSDRYANPAAATVSARQAILNAVLYAGFRSFMRYVHWHHALAMAMSIVG